jgi:hypothetical protein
MASEIIAVRQVIRRMRGGSQAFLVEGEDDQFYIAKFAGNPQGDRTLINEWIAHRLFLQLGASTPPLRVLRLTQDTKQIERLYFQIDGQYVPIESLFHLGSQCPANPTTTAIYDFLPRRLFSKVVNLGDFGTAFVVDKWLAQTDTRQAIFVRERTSSNSLELRLYLIDHGMSFAGRQWETPDSPLYGLYMDRTVYSIVDMNASCEQALSRIHMLTEADLYAAAQDIPSCWFSDSDYDMLAKLFALLEQRRNRLRSIVSRHLKTVEAECNTRLIQPGPILIKENQPMTKLLLAPMVC